MASSFEPENDSNHDPIGGRASESREHKVDTRETARSKARKRALDVLFEADLRGVDPLVVLDASVARSQHPLHPYVRELVAGVAAHQNRIDDLLATYSVGWELSRMPIVDRNVLRIGAWELLWANVPDGVVMSEAADLASSLSTDDSAPFVNGLLAKIVEVRPHLVLGTYPASAES